MCFFVSLSSIPTLLQKMNVQCNGAFVRDIYFFYYMMKPLFLIFASLAYPALTATAQYIDPEAEDADSVSVEQAVPEPEPSVRAVGPTSTTSAPSTVDTMPGKPTKSTTNASAQRMAVLTSQRSSIWQSRPECHFPNTNIRRPKPQRDIVTKMSPCHF